jgi:peptidoglycan/LPS O-acetylase OafA/YrhL
MIKNIYFKGLDGLRFLAAFAVILHHAELCTDIL